MTVSEIENDSRKSKKTASLWLGFFLLMAASIIFFFDSRRMISDSSLQSKNNLILATDPITGKWGKGAQPNIKFQFINFESNWYVASEVYACSSEDDILSNFKKGDTVSIQVDESDRLNKNPTLYGLIKNGKNYIDLSCANRLSAKGAKAAFNSSIISLVLCLLILIFYNKIKLTGDYSYLDINPISIVAVIWIISYFIFK